MTGFVTGLRLCTAIPEACQLLGGISRKSIYDLINSGELETVEIGGRRLVPDFALDRLLEKKSAEPFERICTGRNTPPPPDGEHADVRRQN